MSRRRSLAAAVVALAAATAAVLTYAFRPDAGPAVEAARVAQASPVPPPVLRPASTSGERGVPAYAARFEPGDHGGHRQSWDVVQAPTGLVYIANSDGVLEYDGSDWRLLPVPGFRARAVALGPDEAVYVGGEGTAGVLVPDSTGRLSYREIAGAAELDGAKVWAAVPTERGVLFQAFDRLLAVEGGRVVDVELAPPDRRFHKAFEAGGAAYVRLEGAGLLRYRDRRLVPVDGGERLAEIPVRALFDLGGGPGGPLLGVTDDEMFRIEPGAADPFVPIPTAATQHLRRTRAYHGCSVGPALDAGGAVAITTMGGGVAVIRPDGHVVERLGEAAGLTPDDLVLGCTTDIQGGLWLTLSEAVVRVDAAAPLTAFDANLGLDGAVYDVRRTGGRLYAGTSRGVYRLGPSVNGGPAVFEPVQLNGGDVGQAWALRITSDGGLLVAGTAGVVAVDGLSAWLVFPETTFVLASLSGHADAPVYAGLRNGLAVLRRDGGAWTVAARVDDITGEIRAIRAIAGGAWVAEADGRLLRVNEQGQIVEAFGPDDGVPKGLATVFEIDGALAVLAADGPYRVGRDGGAIQFEPMPGLAAQVEAAAGDLADGYGVWPDGSGRVWVSGRQQTRAITPAAGGSWTDATPAALRGVEDIRGILAEDGVTWMATANGLLRLDHTGDRRYDASGPARVSAVEAGGALAVGDRAVTAPYGSPVRFRFAAAAFNDADRTLYRTQLIGHDGAPSPWSGETLRDYTNLPPGDYAFRVEARTAQGAPARPATVAVRVPAPWHRTPWAAFLGVLLAGAAVLAIALAASEGQRLHAETERARAHAESARADELDRLNAELRRADEIKDSMLANTSHELRTPLTAILGFSEVLTEHEDEEVRSLAGHMLSGGRRLLHTVNDLLDIARLRSGKVALRPASTDAAEVARGVAAELRPLAAGKGLSLAVVPHGLAVPAVLDPQAFARVVTNLVSNGVKFTDAGGVTITVDAAAGDVCLDVTDTGRGMDAEFLPRLYETFEQESSGYGRTAEGSGLGMAITARLVALMGGTIDVTSAPDEGTQFRVRIPAQAEAVSVTASHPLPDTDSAAVTSESPAVGAGP